MYTKGLLVPVMVSPSNTTVPSAALGWDTKFTRVATRWPCRSCDSRSAPTLLNRVWPLKLARSSSMKGDWDAKAITRRPCTTVPLLLMRVMRG